jgi:hypothetical protein
MQYGDVNMLAANKREFVKLFNALKVPMEYENLIYPLNKIIFLVLLAILSGADSWRNIEHMVKKNKSTA